MPGPPHRPLRIVLGVFALLSAVGGLLLILGGKPTAMRLFLGPPEAEISTLLLALPKEMGGFVLMLSLMLFFASRVTFLLAAAGATGRCAPQNCGVSITV